MATKIAETERGNTGHPEVFTVAPSDCAPKKPGQLTEKEVKEYFDKGFVVIKNFFDFEILDACRDAIDREVAQLAQKLYNAEKITKLYAELGFYERLTAIEQEFPGATIILHKMAAMPQEFCDLWSNDYLLNVVEQLLGSPEITGSPVWNLRPKTPNNEATTVPWHQDSSYLDRESDKVLIVSAWIPLLDATPDNGCMQFVAGGHRKGRLAQHSCCYGGTWYTMMEEEDMRKTLGVDLTNAITCPVPYGGMVLFSNLVPHKSLPNMSECIRWSLDLRWQKTGLPCGLWGLKDGVRMRSSDPNFRSIDWKTFNETDRNKQQFAYLEQETDEFDTTVQGPWMKEWDLVHMNRHTDAFEKDRHNPSKIPQIVG